MKNKPILIFAGQENSVFFEIFFKSLKKNKYKTPLILVASVKQLKKEMKKHNFKRNINLYTLKSLQNQKLKNKEINLINIEDTLYKNFRSKKNDYVNKGFDICFKILKSGYSKKFINGPINKSQFLNRKHLGITEFVSKKFKIKNTAMLIYNKDLSVCPITTHLPLKLVTKKITKKLIKDKAFLIDDFFRKNFGFRPKIAVTGLNPHCESILKFNEDIQIIKPAIKSLKKSGCRIDGPFSADTIFLKQNRKKFNVIIGMYHDQVLSPLKSLKEYDAINITLGLPFYRISPDHGPNESMLNKNLSNPLSLTKAIKFLDNK
jgi:4-hydroxythreonine-4-phosphate dehydrogenase